jgi:hypothetical protein
MSRYAIVRTCLALVCGFVATACLPALARAGIDLPGENPAAKLSQQVGFTEIALEYTSPAVRGRKIWGGVVPFERLWSISPEGGPLIRFSKDVLVGDKPVAAGAYRLSAVPYKEKWTLVLTPQPPSADAMAAGALPPAARAEIKVTVVAKKAAGNREHLAFQFADFSDERALLVLEWEKLSVQIPIATNTNQLVQRGIRDLDDAWRSYAQAARFMLENKKDFDAGLKYANQSLALKEDWYTRWIKAALLAGKRDYREATAEAERAYQMGPDGGDAFVVLEPQLKKNIADWRKLSTP